ncbi:putative ABC-class ATPase [Tamilnaduibacter salinus]|uniref:Putative ABC-class ATPase n=1 Tax=Tamilnaduibacter salinus TaxID=1484056 RepID=A0A2U1CWD9_9GAMM|nr:ABC-ATPase domain-containing protein [Tamilnaduibacter salinus]PVY76325.1 putative ABC-class ATPase [Tamilnaduibacter salinus]
MEALTRQLERIDGRGYKAYKSIAGEYRFDGFSLMIDHVQADPFAAPSRCRAVIDAPVADLPASALRSEPRRRAARDFIARAFRSASDSDQALAIDAGHQTVLDRTATVLDDGAVEVRFTVQLPARGRTILGRQARTILCDRLPDVVRAAATSRRLDLDALETHMARVEDQVALREELARRGLVAFVANQSVLPRRSGVDDRPLEQAIPFQAPESLSVRLDTPNAGPVDGLGITTGITLIVGGGFHGKSTLLSAIAEGVYDHIPGDGRDRVVTDPDATKIRAEDGRAVHQLDLSPYINHLPYGKDTQRFSTDLASGSTSQAAALQEAIECGARTLLVDEDTSATNFMIRDRRMQALVAKEREPITPFVDRIRQLRDDLAVSTLLVMGGSGDYFDCADTVIQMQDYQPLDVTREARDIAQAHVTGRTEEAVDALDVTPRRALQGGQLNPEAKPGKTKIQARGRDTLIFGRTDVDLRAVEQIVDASQVRAIGMVLGRLSRRGERVTDLPALIGEWLNDEQWHRMSQRPEGNLARPRVSEVMAALNRLRGAPFES